MRLLFDRALRGSSLVFCLALLPMQARAADPILMFILGFARDMIEQHATKRPSAPPPPPPVVQVYPGTLVEPKLLRQLIDDSFLYLSNRQRAEIFDALHASLMDPKNAAFRGPLIEHFASKALAVRAVQLRLGQLNSLERRDLVVEFGKEVAGLDPQERAELAALLRQQLLPIPADLSAMLLVRLESASAIERP